ncbi:major coat protein [Morganella morganii]|uniref:major coat protein n=1 Tax=Morganella morganii TaxID=582 RepID=UPI00237ECF0E|nr:major coat protein [Morganella morganii]EKQ1116232.1 phage coat protein [Morganella morganii]MDE2538860.1 phage coat protein [Morganella morganii]HCL5894959.1 phage coat protein [Morganella morganii]
MKVKNKIIFSALSLFSGVALAEGGSSNQGTLAAKEAFASITSLANEFISMAWPLVTLLVGALIGIKLFKKFANKAS